MKFKKGDCFFDGHGCIFYEYEILNVTPSGRHIKIFQTTTFPDKPLLNVEPWIYWAKADKMKYLFNKKIFEKVN
jgi:hypothetical protein